MPADSDHMTEPKLSVAAVLAEIRGHMSATRRRQFAVLLVLLLLGAVAELATIGTVLPFLALLVDPSGAERLGPLAALLERLSGDRQHLLLMVTAAFAVTALMAGIIRVALSWTTHAFIFRLGHELGVEIHKRLLYQPYTYHIQRNSSEFIAAHEKLQMLTFSVLLPLMLAGSAAIIAVFIMGILLYLDPVTAIIAAAAFCAIYVAVSFVTRRRIESNSKLIDAAHGHRIQLVQESLGGIRDIIIDQSQPFYVEQFRTTDIRFRDAQAVNLFIGAAPRFVIEAAGMAVIAAVALLLTGRSGGAAEALPALGALALGAQRLLPLLQQVYYGWAQAKGNWPVAASIVELLELPIADESALRAPLSPLPFNREIRFNNVTFCYPGRDERVLSEVGFRIEKGTRTALIGRTGSGKSTLTDLLMGLLEPSEGTITVDGVPLVGKARLAWQAQIAHVPQAIYLADSTIERNIAFGVPECEIDARRVQAAARQAQLDEFVSQLPDGYESRIGERGVRLSGGQRQRLGIARALYKNARVLILDEATSALDRETEAAVIRSIHGLDEALTIVMIAHRLSSIADCDAVIRLEQGRIVETGSFENVVRPSQYKNSVSPGSL